MSRHGVCFDNGNSGNCNINCEQYRMGDCEEHEEVFAKEFDLDIKERYGDSPEAKAVVSEVFGGDEHPRVSAYRRKA